MREERRILSGTEENPITEVTTTWNDDGTRVECYENHETSEGIIRELDAQGNLVRETFGRFYEPPEISDEELDKYMRELLGRRGLG